MANSIRRRDVITLAAGAAAAWPFVARAQQGEPMRRIGVLAGAGYEARIDAFKRGLAGLGWAEDRNIRFVERYATDSNEAVYAAYAAELARLAPDAIFVAFSSVLRAMRRASGDIPIVFAQVNDPVEQGFVSSLAHPGGNITGFAASEFGIVTKQLDLLKKLAPSLERVAFLYDQAQPAPGTWAGIEAAAPLLALTASKVSVRTAEEIERAIAALAREPNSGLLVSPGQVAFLHREMMAMLAIRHRLPAMYYSREFVESGGLGSYATDAIDGFRRAASYVDRILRGEKPRDLPVQLPTRFELVLNLRTAKAMGLDIPPNVLVLADEIIE